jgi:uncharacterized protein
MSGRSLNVLGGVLEPCSLEPLTGFYRDGCCETGPEDSGRHTICVRVTRDFLRFSKSVGNDLSTPRPEFRFAGLKPGDRWCVCASRWVEALDAGVAPPVIMASTHHKALDIATMQDLLDHALDAPERANEEDDIPF